jgi:schlafen family protein
MSLSEQDIQKLIANPRESLAIELKDWIYPDTDDGIGKIVKTMIAMRNHNGGKLLLGFNDSDGSPSESLEPENLEERFHIDVIQGIISKYSSELFEVQVYYPELDGNKFIIMEAPPGVKTPVVAKKDLVSGDTYHIRRNKVYIRSLNASNVPSTTEALWKDWSTIIEICFENREADVGRFIRRHISNLRPDHIDELVKIYKGDDKDERLHEFLSLSKSRFDHILQERSLTPPPHGSCEVASIVSGEVPIFKTDQTFLNVLFANNPSYSGWPAWVDSRRNMDIEARPFVNHGVWESLMYTIGGTIFDHLDYWRLSPKGFFYLYREIQDDLSGRDRAPNPKSMDFGLPILRAFEAIATAIEYYKAMGCNIEESVHFIFKWSDLKDRVLCSWANPLRGAGMNFKSYQKEKIIQLVVPLDAPTSVLPEYVHIVINELYLTFEGYNLPKDATVNIIEEFLKVR